MFFQSTGLLRRHFTFLRFQIHSGTAAKNLIPREIPTHSNSTQFYEPTPACHGPCAILKGGLQGGKTKIDSLAGIQERIHRTVEFQVFVGILPHPAIEHDQEAPPGYEQ